jgi:hypothetical protein
MIINNNKDPLKAGPPAGQVLLERFGQVSEGFPLPVVLDAAINLLLNCIRQSCGKRNLAFAAIDEVFGKSKTILAAHYDAVTGNRRSIFAHTQHVVMDTFKDPDGL